MQKQYEDSADFTAELERAGSLLQELQSIVGQQRWAEWMASTDANFATNVYKRNSRLRLELSLLVETFEDLEEELHSAG